MASHVEMLYSYSIFVEAAPYRMRFNELMKRADKLRALCQQGELHVAGFTNIVGDCWYAFYQQSGTFVASFPNATHAELLQALLATEEYKRWHRMTQQDELLSILTAMHLAEQLLKYLEPTMFDRFASGQPPTAEQKLQAVTRTHCAAWLLNSSEEARQTKSAIQMVGQLNDNNIEEMPITEQFSLASALQSNPTLMKIADMTGKLKKIVMKKQKQKHEDTMARQHIALGQEMSRLLPLELANYIMPHSKADFLRRLSEHQTFVFDKRGKDSRGRGPIIICMDESSSMTSIKVESKAFCLALLYIAKKQRRDLAIIPFASDIGAVQLFVKGQCDTAQLVAYSEAFLGGGTNYEKPLQAALDILTTSQFKQADIIFVTDGSSFLSTRFIEEFQTLKKQKQFECTTVVLKNHYHAVDLRIVERFSTRVMEVDHLFDASDVFAI